MGAERGLQVGQGRQPQEREQPLGLPGHRVAADLETLQVRACRPGGNHLATSPKPETITTAVSPTPENVATQDSTPPSVSRPSTPSGVELTFPREEARTSTPASLSDQQVESPQGHDQSAASAQNVELPDRTPTETTSSAEEDAARRDEYERVLEQHADALDPRQQELMRSLLDNLDRHRQPWSQVNPGSSLSAFELDVAVTRAIDEGVDPEVREVLRHLFGVPLLGADPLESLF
jgi:hypothetical protein